MDILPLELKYQIIQYLDINDILNLFQVNTEWYNYYYDDNIWKYLVNRDFKINNQLQENWNRTYKSVYQLHNSICEMIRKFSPLPDQYHPDLVKKIMDIIFQLIHDFDDYNCHLRIWYNYLERLNKDINTIIRMLSLDNLFYFPIVESLNLLPVSMCIRIYIYKMLSQFGMYNKIDDEYMITSKIDT